MADLALGAAWEAMAWFVGVETTVLADKVTNL